jgi:Protein of unknown function (DUF3551)
MRRAFLGAGSLLRRLDDRRVARRGAKLSVLHQGLRFRRTSRRLQFFELPQCQATASCRDAYCDANPYFNASAELRPNRSRQTRRRF